MQKKTWFPIAVAVAAGMLAGAFLTPRAPVGAQAPQVQVAQQPGGPPPPGGPGMFMAPGGPGGPQFPGMRPPVSPVMVATSEFVYVLVGRNLYQYSAKDLKLANKATLPEEAPRPAGPPPAPPQ